MYKVVCKGYVLVQQLLTGDDAEPPPNGWRRTSPRSNSKPLVVWFLCPRDVVPLLLYEQ